MGELVMIKPATMEFVSLSNGETIAYQEVGRRNTDILVLIHGNMTSSQHWDLVIEKLQDQYHIYALDLRGFGQSTYNQSIDSLQDFADDVKLFIDELKLEKFSLMGWSMGGGVAMQFTANHPTFVEKLILVESVGMKGYPIFKKDTNGRTDCIKFSKDERRNCARSSTNRSSIRCDKKYEQTILPYSMESINIYT